jgi:small GTP-binding protein
MGKYSNFFSEYKINDYLILKLENNRTNIYIKGKIFSQCKFLLLSIPQAKIREYDDLESIDEAAERMDSTPEGRKLRRYQISPQTEFFGHCSNLQAWYENNYDTRLIHSNLAFPLLKTLMKAGDPVAKKVFKEEISTRFKSAYPSVVTYLLNQKYLKSLKRKERKAILKDPTFIKNVKHYTSEYYNLPRWFYKKIRKLITEKTTKRRVKPDEIRGYSATYKIVIFGDKGVPKTQLVQRYLTNLFKSDSKMTIGVDFEVKSLIVDNKRVKLQIWDFGGEERFRFLLPTYVRGANGALFLYDVNNYMSLAHIDDWLLVIKKELRRPEEQFPIIVVGIVSDVDDREVTAEEGINIAKARGVDGFIECVPRTGENVDATFEALTRIMLARSGIVPVP